MSRIRPQNTSPEIIVRKALFSNGFRYRLHLKKLPGKPDIVLPKYKTVIFVNGCFWHGHDDCKYFVVPKTKTDWWLTKINTIKKHDEINAKTLVDAGWNVLIIWECELKPPNREATIQKVIKNLKNND